MVTVGRMFKNLSRICAEDCAVLCANPWRMRSVLDALREPAVPAFGDGSESADRERDSEDAEIVVVDLIPQPRIADLIEPLELIEADGIAIGHEQAMEHDGQTCLAEGVHLLGFTEQFGACGNQQVLAVVRIDIG